MLPCVAVVQAPCPFYDAVVEDYARDMRRDWAAAPRNSSSETVPPEPRLLLVTDQDAKGQNPCTAYLMRKYKGLVKKRDDSECLAPLEQLQCILVAAATTVTNAAAARN